MNAVKRVCASLAMLGLMAACGGGSDSGGQSYNNQSPPSNPPVSGEFKNSADTGRFFGFNFGTFYQNEYNFGASECRDNTNDYYFETDRLYVFGSRSFPESDFRTVASWVEGQMAQAASLVGESNFADIVSERNDIAPEANGLLYDYFVIQEFSSVVYPVPYNEFVGWDFDEQISWFADYFRDLSRSRQNEVVEEAASFAGFTWQDETEYRLGSKLLVCVNRNTSPNEYAHGGRYGVSIAAPSLVSRSDSEQVILHELIHAIQQMTYDSYPNEQTLPRWFFEGQAVYLSGQPIASERDAGNFKTPSFITFGDESNVDVGEIYRHYGRAYKYLLDANDIATLMRVLENIDDSDFHFPGSFPSLEDQQASSYDFNDGFNSHRLEFIEAFNSAGLQDAAGQPLTLERFKRDYESLVGQ